TGAMEPFSCRSAEVTRPSSRRISRSLRDILPPYTVRMHVNTPSSQGWGLSLVSLAVLQHGQGSRAHFRGKINTIDTHPQPVIHRLAQVCGPHPPHRKGPDIVLFFERRGQLIDGHLMPDDLITSERGRLYYTLVPYACPE